MRCVSRRLKAHKGQAIIESTVSIILFAMLIALVMTVTLYLYIQQAMVTAAREGARMASLNADMATDEAAGTTTVKEYVKNEIAALTGQTATDDDITVLGPSSSANQTAGERTVTVSINYTMDNPVNIAGFINALGGDGSAFDNIPVQSSATMRYEE